jgi:small conductance mechanosensitive channel
MAIEMTSFINLLQTVAIKYFAKFIYVAVILIAGIFIAKNIKKLLSIQLAKVNPTSQSFISNAVFILIVIFSVVMSLSVVGVHTSSIIAIIGSIGIAIGLAFQSSLSNISAGLMIILFKPFKVDDYVEINDVGGTVREIGLFHITLLQADNTSVVIPNSRVLSDKILNYTDQMLRRVDIQICIDYGQDVAKIKEILFDIVMEDDRILRHPAPLVVVLGFKDIGVNIGLRPWTSKEEYWNVLWDVQEKVEQRFTKNHIRFAKPSAIR